MPGAPAIEVRKNARIRLPDGVRLAADLYLPPGDGPFPTLVSTYPYHKDDYIGVMSDAPCRFFAAHGYASLLVDFRGTGGSEGLAWEPFDPREQEDGAAVVEWAAAEPWCDGNVGMWGVSYGGITSLQAASRRPPHLKAIAVLYGCTDAFGDFVYPGGAPNCLSAWGSWGSLMLAMNLMPPTYAGPDEEWRRIWQDRLGKARPYALSWKEHPTFDEYWKAGVIPVEEIEAPALLIGGWRELFPEAMMRIFGELRSPKKMFVGPWTHMPPSFSFDLEPMDHLAELLRWWDRWLKGEGNGVTDEPALTYFVQGGDEWRQASEWPPPGGEKRTLFLCASGRLAPSAPAGEDGDVYEADPTVGATAGLWELMALGIGRPLDQGPDDRLSLTYTTEPLDEDVEIGGSPEATLHVVLDGDDEVQLVAKLVDVAPDGGSTLVTTGWLDLRNPEASRETSGIMIRLWATAYRIAKGHRIRLSLSCSDFPRIFPTPTNPTIRVLHGGANASSVRIPLDSTDEDPSATPAIRRPDPTQALAAATLLEAFPKWRIENDLVSRSVTITSGLAERFGLSTGGHVAIDHEARASVSAVDPAGARVDARTTMRVGMATGEDVRVETTTQVSRTSARFTGKITIDDDDIFEKEWQSALK